MRSLKHDIISHCSASVCVLVSTWFGGSCFFKLSFALFEINLLQHLLM